MTWHRLVPLLFPLVVLLATGVRGLDLGFHWDERMFQVRPVKHMVRTGILLPDYYGYPSLAYWINAAAVAPDVPAAWRGPGGRERLLAAMDSHDYLLRLRATYLVLASLSLVWVYWLVLRWRASPAEALLAASFLGLSWEVAYHSRWVATDTLLMQFGALTLLLSVVFWLEPHRPALLYLAAVTAGLGFGSKYPGGLLIVPVAVAAGRVAGGWRPDPRRLLGVVAAFAATYLVTTPATVLQPAAFLRDVLYEIGHYTTGHAGHTVAPGWEHGVRMLVYFAGVLFSAFPPLALAVFVFVLIGLYAMVREGGPSLLFLSFPALYLAYFTTQGAMVVRNLLVVAPFAAVLAARGVAWSWERRRGAGVARPALAVLVAVVLLVNAGWLAYAAETIADRRTDRFVREAAAYLAADRAPSVWLSPRLQIQLAAIGSELPPNVVGDPGRADRLVLYASEGMARWDEWPANRLRLTERSFGPYEVNFDVYPSWWGDDRIIVVSRARALAVALLPVAPGRFEASLPNAATPSTPMTRSGVRSPLSSGLLHPCALLSRDEIAREIGPIVHGPFGGTAVNGRACQYVGARRAVAVGVLRIGVAVFEALRPELGDVAAVDTLGDDAYWHVTGPGDVSLFVRSGGIAILIRVTAADERVPAETAIRLARAAVGRLGAR